MALCTQKMSTIISLPEMMAIKKKYQQVGWVGNIQGKLCTIGDEHIIQGSTVFKHHITKNSYTMEETENTSTRTGK